MARREAPSHAHRVRGATRPHRAPRHLRGQPREGADRRQAREARVRHEILEGVPGPDDHLHELPATMSRDQPEAPVRLRAVSRRTRLQAPEESRTAVREPGPLGGRHHRGAGGRRRLPRLAGDLRLAGDGDRVALRSGVLPDARARRAAGLPRPWPCLPPRRARRRLPQLHGPDRR